MKFFSAIGKRLADKANSNLTKKQTKQAQRNAYMATGRKIKQAKKNHKRIKGSSVYRAEFKKEMQKFYGGAGRKAPIFWAKEAGPIT